MEIINTAQLAKELKHAAAEGSVTLTKKVKLN